MPVYPGVSAVASQIDPPPTMPSFIAVGTGSGHTVDTNTLTPGAPAGIASGHLLILQVLVRSSVFSSTVSTPTDWTLIYNDVSPTAAHIRQVLFTRVYDGIFAMPTITWSSVGGTNPAARSRIHAFADTDGTMEGSSTAGGSADATIEIPSVTTTGPSRLVLCFASAQNNNLGADATGEAGGDYTQLAGGNTVGGGGAVIMVQAAPMASAGVISGGVITIASGTPNWVVRTFALLPL